VSNGPGAFVGKWRRAWQGLVQAVRDDHAMLHHYDAKYGPNGRDDRPSLARDLVTRIGFQMLADCRVMRFCVDAEIPLAPRVASRLIRHAYGSDVHWETQLEPGIVFVHGMGMAISRSARVERGAILFQNVTLGAAFDSTSGSTGAPLVHQSVHVGAGSTLVGPITIGARSKVTANCFVRSSIPADSIVEAPAPLVSARRRPGTASETDNPVVAPRDFTGRPRDREI
jgi:serine O-acetyltransferase